MKCLPRSACLGSLSLTQFLEFNGTWGMFGDQGQPSWFEDQSLHVLGPSRLCAQAQSGDDTPFHKQACMEYTQLVFCSIVGIGLSLGMSRYLTVWFIAIFGYLASFRGLPVKQTCRRHHLQSPTLLSTPIMNRGEYLREPTRNYQTEPHDLDFVPEPIYPEYIPLEDEHILSTEGQPLPPIVSPTAESSGYVAKSDPKEDHEEYEEDEVKDGPVDYHMDGGDYGDDDDDDNSSGYDADDEDEDNKDKEEEEEHLAPADFDVVIPIDELAEVERLLAMSIPPPSPLTSLSPPSAGERLARCTAPAALSSPLLPPFSYPPPLVDRRDGIPESEQPPRKRMCLSTLASRYEVGESSTRGQGVDYRFTDTVEAEMRHRGIREVGYRIRDIWIDPAEAVLDMASTTLEKVNTRVAELAELHEHDTQDLYALLEDAQDETLRVMRDIRREMGDMQAELLALHGQPRRAGQPRGDVRVPNHQDAPRDADSHI
nr:hypothetical protein [Tanacetum cinerariifolium]